MRKINEKEEQKNLFQNKKALKSKKDVTNRLFFENKQHL
jgi:hypothetical protein